MMRMLQRIGSWPLAVKLPLLVAGLMIAIAVLISQVVLGRLVQDQEANLRLLTGAYLDGLSSAVLQPVMRSDVWETFDALDRARHRYAGVDALYTIVALPNGAVLASSEPEQFPVQSPLSADFLMHFPDRDDLAIDSAGGRAWLTRTLREEGVPVGRILAEVDIADLLQVRQEVLMTLILVNGLLAIIFACVGYVMLKRMLQPLGILSQYVERVRDGRAEPIPDYLRTRMSREFDHLFRRFNAMARAVNERETLSALLAEREKDAILGKLASGMAHEINNPLGGMLNAIDTLKIHGNRNDVRQASLDLIERGLRGIRDVVRSALMTYRGSRDRRDLQPQDIDDLRLLAMPEVRRKGLDLGWCNELREVVPLPASEVRQIALNLLLNACHATRLETCITFQAHILAGELVIIIEDSGPGLPPEAEGLLAGSVEKPAAFGDGRGLGLWVTSRLVLGVGGRIETGRSQAGGARVVVKIPLSLAPEAMQGIQNVA